MDWKVFCFDLPPLRVSLYFRLLPLRKEMRFRLLIRWSLISADFWVYVGRFWSCFSPPLWAGTTSSPDHCLIPPFPAVAEGCTLYLSIVAAAKGLTFLNL